MPGFSECGGCPLKDDVDVTCAAVITGHRPFCTSPDPAMPEAVRRMSYEMAGRPLAAEPAEFPPLVVQVVNLAGAMGRFAASGLQRRTPEQRATISAICRGCEFSAGSRCIKCGCQLAYKQAMASEHCPLDPPKW